MKIRVTLMTENDVIPSQSKEETEQAAIKGWELLCALMNVQSTKNERCTVESVELVED